MKLPFSFNFKFLFRLLLPGFLVSFSLFPVLKVLCNNLHITIDTEYFLILSTVLFGWFFVIADMHIYMLFEGRRYWPKWIRDKFHASEKNRLSKLLEKYELAKNKKDRNNEVEISVELRRFPIDSTGKIVATMPTRIGNLLSSYEEYPLRVYGMDSIFYWYRIWVVINDDLREHIDNQQAIVDSTMYISTSLVIVGIISVFYLLIKPFSAIELPSQIMLLTIAVSAFLLSYIIYRTSLYLHASFGELYKSIFDMYRNEINVDDIVDRIANIVDNEEIINFPQNIKYKIALSFLNNDRVKTKEGNMVSAVSYMQKNNK